MTDSRSLLIVEDDISFRERLVRAMRDRGFEATGVPDHPSAMHAAQTESPELALVDLRLPGESGLAVVRDLKALDASTVVVVLTGYGSIATAVESIKLGAASYLTKPADADQIVAAFDGTQRQMTRKPRHWLGSSGSTSKESSPIATATFRRRLGSWESIGDRYNESLRSDRCRGKRSSYIRLSSPRWFCVSSATDVAPARGAPGSNRESQQ
jgi:ActR/RegA family two-component response regulator